MSTSSVMEEVEAADSTYLRPRVESILSGNCLNIPPGNHNAKDDKHDKAAHNEEDNFLRVYLRVKKAENFEKLYKILHDNTLFCKVPDGAHCIRNQPYNQVVKMFKFSKIFGPQTTQTEVFKDVIYKKVTDVINGINSTLLTYGASGSGKTFTIVGTATEPRIIPRALEYLFCSLPELPHEPNIKPTPSGGIIKLTRSKSSFEKCVVNNIMNQLGDRSQHFKTYSIMQEQLRETPAALIEEDISNDHLSVWITFAEIYNEYVYDLLTPEPKRGQTRKKLRLVYFNNNAYIKDLRHISVSSAAEAYYLLQYGLQNLNYASTAINDHSSRSHSIFTIKLAQASDSKDGVSVSSFNFCDLAGSERLKKTNNIGDRLKESNNINASLLVLGRCIKAIRDSQKTKSQIIVPFRESKLTQLFQNALLGNESISMIVCINPIRDMFDETQHVLNFSAIAKEVTVEVQQVIQRPKNNKFTNYMQNTLENSVIMEEQSVFNVEELENFVALLISEIETEKSNYAEEREQIINTYKTMIANTNKVWENTCQNLQKRIREQRQKHFKNAVELSNEIEKQSCRKRKKISIVIIDSSSDEENEDPNVIRKKKKPNANHLQHLQNQICTLKQEAGTKQIELQNILAKNKHMRELLQDATSMYQTLLSDYQNEVLKLKTEIVKQEDTLAELNSYIDISVMKKIDDCGNEQKSETLEKSNIPKSEITFDESGVPRENGCGNEEKAEIFQKDMPKIVITLNDSDIPEVSDFGNEEKPESFEKDNITKNVISFSDSDILKMSDFQNDKMSKMVEDESFPTTCTNLSDLGFPEAMCYENEEKSIIVEQANATFDVL